MIFPVVTLYILEFLFVNLPATQVDSDVFIVVIFSQELADRVYRVAI